MSEWIISLYNTIIDNLKYELYILTFTFFVVFISRYKEKIINKILKFKKKNVYLDKNTIDVISKINEELTILRYEANADRAYIIEFHNGGEFFVNRPRFRMSLTYEKVDKGISNEYNNMQNMDVSLYWDYVKFLFLKDTEFELPPGVSKLEKNNDCDSPCKTDKNIYLTEIYKIDRNLQNDAYMLEDKNVVYTIKIAIINESDIVLGYVGLDYMDEDSKIFIMDKGGFIDCKLCRFSEFLIHMWNINSDIKKTNSN